MIGLRKLCIERHPKSSPGITNHPSNFPSSIVDQSIKLLNSTHLSRYLSHSN